MFLINIKYFRYFVGFVVILFCKMNLYKILYLLFGNNFLVIWGENYGKVNNDDVFKMVEGGGFDDVGW